MASYSYIQRVKSPAITAPMIGATQNSQSWPIYAPPANSAGPVLRAGLTEVLVTGIDTRWIKVSARPIGMPAKPVAAPFRRRADDDEQEEEGHHHFGQKAAAEAVFAGAEIAIPVGGETAGDPTGLAGGDHPQYQRRR